MPLRFLLHLPVLALAGSLLVACGGDDDAQSMDETPEAAESAAADVSLDLPADFPKDVPVYPDMEIVFAVSVGMGNKLRAVSGDGVQEIADFYRDKMPANGWTLDENQNYVTATAQALQFRKNGRLQVVKIVANAQETTVEMTLMNME